MLFLPASYIEKLLNPDENILNDSEKAKIYSEATAMIRQEGFAGESEEETASKLQMPVNYGYIARGVWQDFVKKNG